MSKVVLLFLIFIAVMAIMGRLRMPELFKRSTIRKTEKCAKCGAHKFDGVSCRCKDKG